MDETPTIFGTETQIPLSIRTNNPGGQWYGPIAKQYGATGAQSAAGGNNAAIFPDPVSGAAAHFGLLAKNYAGMPLSAAIDKWSGGNSSPRYTAFVAKNAGLAPDAVLTPELLSGPQGIALTRAQARWEAGRDYPLTNEQWGEAQRRAFGGAPAPGPAIGASTPETAQAAPAVNPGGTLAPSVQGMIDPNQSAWKMFEKFGGGRGMLNGQGQGESHPPPPMMQLPNGTPTAQAIRQQLLANFLQQRKA